MEVELKILRVEYLSNLQISPKFKTLKTQWKSRVWLCSAQLVSRILFTLIWERILYKPFNFGKWLGYGRNRHSRPKQTQNLNSSSYELKPKFTFVNPVNRKCIWKFQFQKHPKSAYNVVWKCLKSLCGVGGGPTNNLVYPNYS